MDIIDAHAHCWVTDRSKAQTFEDHQGEIAATDIAGGCAVFPVLEICDRYDFYFIVCGKTC